MSTPAGHARRSLPRYLTSFVGREEEITQITRLLLRDDVRLVTLTGTGGAGKTRLAVEAVSRLAPDTWADIWYVPLVAIREPALVPTAIAHALGLQPPRSSTATETIVRFLGDQHTLLVIDNVEHVTPASSDLARILGSCPGVTMLLTSRIALRISGEHPFTLPPLQTPPETDLAIDHLRANTSIQLFLERASASGRTLTLTDNNARAIAGICRRLDGLPLALELAAARSAILPPSTLLDLLQRDPRVLSGGPLDAPERHHSMDGAIAWSYDLLPEHEQKAFRRLAVFTGGFTLAAAEAIVDLDINMADILTSLATKSLIVPNTPDHAEARFTILETIREYGLARLADTGELAPTRDSHAAYFLQEAVEGDYAWLMPFAEGAAYLARLQSDYPNMRAAMVWLEGSGDLIRALQLAGSLGALWTLCGYGSEGRSWLDRLLARQVHTSDPIHVTALATLSWLGHKQGTFDEALRLAQEGLSLLRSQDEPLLVIRCLILAGMAAVELEKLEMAIRMFEEAMERTRSLHGPEWWQNWVNIALLHLGNALLMQGRIDEADARFREIVARQDRHGYEPGTSYINGYMVLTGMGRVARARGDHARALDLFQQSLAMSRHLARWKVSNVSFIVRITGLIAGSLAAIGKAEDAARLFGASCALGKRYGYQFAETAHLRHEFGILPETLPRSRDAHVMSPTAAVRHDRSFDHIQRAWDEGRAWTLETAIDRALAASAEPSPRLSDLTPRELDVLRLVADGYSNRAIANILFLSERTVEHHVTHILARLHLESRIAAAVFAVRNELL